MRATGTLATFIAASLTACAAQSIETVPVSDVLTAVKSQLATLKPEFVIPAGTGASCYVNDHDVRVVAIPTKAVVDFKTVVTAADNGSGSANIPAGPSGVIVSPSLGASFSNIATTDITLNLGVQHTPPTVADLQAEMTSLQKYISSGNANVKDLKANGGIQGKDAIAKTQANIRTAQARLTQDEISFADIENRQGPTPITGPSPFDAKALPDPTPGSVIQNLSIASAFNKAIEGILETSHVGPCFLPQELDVKVNFEVVKGVNGGLAVTFLVAKIGATSSKTDDATQSITLTFDLSQGTTSSGATSGGGS